MYKYATTIYTGDVNLCLEMVLTCRYKVEASKLTCRFLGEEYEETMGGTKLVFDFLILKEMLFWYHIRLM